MKPRFFIILISLCFYQNLSAQNVLTLKEKIADNYFHNMAYLQAIATYEDILKEDPSRISVLPKLATSYRKISDYSNAERVFTRLLKTDSTNAQYVLEYAQVLAVNKKYPESAIQYKRYATLNPLDTTSLEFITAYETILNKNCKITVAITNFNSGQSDFSPAFYKQGLVFVSNRSYNATIKRTFEWDQTSFLNLYFIPDTGSIKKASQVDTADGKSRRRKIQYNDDDTRLTSNDSRTMGTIGYKYVDTSNMFATPDVIVNDFSKKIKTKYHEGPVTFSTDQKTIIFTRNNYNKGHARKSDEGINKLKLYSATIDDDGEWTGVKPLNINNNNYSIGHPAFGAGDTILYFVSDKPGGFGGTDLYKSYLRNEEWSTPENLGPQINTSGNEQFPYIDKQGILYFSSNGHPGIGGLDLFKTSLTDIHVENMGIPVNSSYDDFGIALDETATRGYLSSNRRRGVNDDDIYQITIEKPAPFIIKIIDSITQELISAAIVLVTDDQHQITPTDSSATGEFNTKLWNATPYTFAASASRYNGKTITLTTDINQPVLIVPLTKAIEGCIVAGTITSKETKLPIQGATIVIKNKTSGDTLYQFTTGADGKYRYASLKENISYQISVYKDGYFIKPAIVLNTKGANCFSKVERPYDFLRDFELEQIIIGKAIKIDNIYFDLAKYNIRKDAAKELDKIVLLMKNNPDIIIELSSHTDCRASFKYNMTLSDNRAKSSAAYIVSKGIASNRITGKGYGETKLVNDCGCEGKTVTRTCSEAEHQANRRTEFQVTGFLSDANTEILNNGKGETPSSVPAVPSNKE